MNTSSPTDPIQVDTWQKVVGTNKKGRTYGLISAPRPNYHEAGPFGIAHVKSDPLAHVHDEIGIMKGMILKQFKKINK
ncbi:hypothetical protein CDL15_Pgr026319 [Punica granatum]|nr:hypothetical protein CDL15_Pgr026319 [Punica granatum]